MALKDYPNLRASLGQRVASNLSRTLNIRKGIVRRRKNDNSGDDQPMAFVMFAWDACDPCRHHDCPLIHICDPPDNTDLCIVQKKYLRGVALAIGESYIDQMIEDQTLSFRIGSELFPLYKMLVKLKMAELTVLDPVIDGLKVGPRVHPVFKEIRETISTIDRTYAKLGIKKVNNPNFPLKSSSSDYYSKMEQEEWGKD